MNLIQVLKIGCYITKKNIISDDLKGLNVFEYTPGFLIYAAFYKSENKVK
jgi:hypothetical protein